MKQTLNAIVSTANDAELQGYFTGVIADLYMVSSDTLNVYSSDQYAMQIIGTELHILIAGMWDDDANILLVVEAGVEADVMNEILDH